MSLVFYLTVMAAMCVCRVKVNTGRLFKTYKRGITCIPNSVVRKEAIKPETELMSTYRIYYYCYIYNNNFFFGFLRFHTDSVGKSICLRIVNDKNPRVERPVFTTARAVCSMNIWWADGDAVDLQYSHAAGCSGWAPHRLARCTRRIFSVGPADRCNCGPAATARDVPPTLGHTTWANSSPRVAVPVCRDCPLTRVDGDVTTFGGIILFTCYRYLIYLRCCDKSVEVKKKKKNRSSR